MEAIFGMGVGATLSMAGSLASLWTNDGFDNDTRRCGMDVTVVVLVEEAVYGIMTEKEIYYEQ
jgi:hypothetical protein